MKQIKKISLLIDFYGKLLTNKQLLYLNDYYFNDFSLNEIAQNNKVTKNAVYDSIKKSILELEKYESKLFLIKSYFLRMKLYKKINDPILKEEFLKIENFKYDR